MIRRKFLSATGPVALALAGAPAVAAVHVTAPSAPDPDARLIALCGEFDALEHKLRAAFTDITTAADQDRADAMAGTVSDDQAPILDAITALRPSTLAGFKALAGSLVLWDTELLKSDPTEGYTDERLALVLVRSLVGDMPAFPPGRSPDAALLALCAEYQRLRALAYLEGNNDWEAAHDESMGMADKINDLVPVTQAGHRAKAAVVVAEMDDNRMNDGTWMGDREALHALNLLKDWLGCPA